MGKLASGSQFLTKGKPHTNLVGLQQMLCTGIKDHGPFTQSEHFSTPSLDEVLSEYRVQAATTYSTTS